MANNIINKRNSNFTDIDDKINYLKDKLRSLNRHWATGFKVPLDAYHSDNIYKNHLLRLNNVYTNYDVPNEMNYKKFRFPGHFHNFFCAINRIIN